MSITPPIVDEHEHRELLDAAILSFLKQLESAGYAKKTCRDKRAVLRTFADWLPSCPHGHSALSCASCRHAGGRSPSSSSS